MKRRAITVVAGLMVLGLAGVVLVPSLVSAPAVSIITDKQWKNAINAGEIQPVVNWDNGFEFHYPGMAAQLRTPNLKGLKDADPITGGKQPGLVMGWGSAGDDGQDIVGAFEYVFPSASDLTNTLINVSGLSPCSAINSIGMGLRDANGKTMSWAWSVPTGQPCDVPIALTVNPFQGGGGATIPPTSFYREPGFDLTSVQSMTFSEMGVWSAGGPTDPAGFGQRVWNSWDDLTLSATVPVEESSWGQIKDLFTK